MHLNWQLTSKLLVDVNSELGHSVRHITLDNSTKKGYFCKATVQIATYGQQLYYVKISSRLNNSKINSKGFCFSPFLIMSKRAPTLK